MLQLEIVELLYYLYSNQVIQTRSGLTSSSVVMAVLIFPRRPGKIRPYHSCHASPRPPMGHGQGDSRDHNAEERPGKGWKGPPIADVREKRIDLQQNCVLKLSSLSVVHGLRVGRREQGAVQGRGEDNRA